MVHKLLQATSVWRWLFAFDWYHNKQSYLGETIKLCNNIILPVDIFL